MLCVGKQHGGNTLSIARDRENGGDLMERQLGRGEREEKRT